MRMITHRSKRTPDLGPEDLPDWRLGLNVDRSDQLRADLDRTVEAAGAFAKKHHLDFVIGYFNADSGTSEDVAFFKNATTAKQALAAVCSVLEI